MLGHHMNENLLPGIYKMKVSGLVTTWDVRIKRTNSNDYLSSEVLHTLEHTMLDYLQDRYGKYRVLGVFPMGCKTGMSVVTRFIDKRMIYEAIIDYALNLQLSYNIPGDSPGKCGQYKLHDLRGAKKTMLTYYDQTLRFSGIASKYNN